jgi:ectoine hydroxylase-related dioxygenase (phytanoyl-CoA dioxygenase family)
MDSKYQFDWHQDYTFNIMSKSAVTFWVPLTDVSLETGAIQILPGSHLHLHPVSGSRNYEPGKDGNAASHLTFKLFEPNIPHFEAKSIQVPIKSGQVLMFHSHVLHRSGHNLSNGLNRWVAIFRMGDLYDGSFMERNFFCARPNKPQTMAGFSSVHPDYFVEKSDIST